MLTTFISSLCGLILTGLGFFISDKKFIGSGITLVLLGNYYGLILMLTLYTLNFNIKMQIKKTKKFKVPDYFLSPSQYSLISLAFIATSILLFVL